MMPKEVGNISEMCVIAGFVKNGISVALPFGDNQPYDIILDTKHGFKSVQVKHGTYKNGAIFADIRKRIGARRVAYQTYDGIVDYIAIWCEHTNECYLISIKECCNKTYLTLRLEEPNNNSCISKVIWAKDYILRNRIKIYDL